MPSAEGRGHSVQTTTEPALLERPQRSFFARHERLILGGLSVALALVVWQWLCERRGWGAR